MIKIDFEFQTTFGVYKDALYFVEDTLPSPEEVESLKNERLQNWINAITQVPPPPEQFNAGE